MAASLVLPTNSSLVSRASAHASSLKRARVLGERRRARSSANSRSGLLGVAFERVQFSVTHRLPRPGLLFAREMSGSSRVAFRANSREALIGTVTALGKGGGCELFGCECVSRVSSPSTPRLAEAFAVRPTSLVVVPGFASSWASPQFWWSRNLDAPECGAFDDDSGGFNACRRRSDSTDSASMLTKGDAVSRDGSRHLARSNVPAANTSSHRSAAEPLDV